MFKFNSPKKGVGLPFRFPYIASLRYNPGLQPNSPGESAQPYGAYPGSFFHAIPWPNAVNTVGALANFPGIARDYPIAIDNNAYATLPNQILFIGGFSGKSQG